MKVKALMSSAGGFSITFFTLIELLGKKAIFECPKCGSEMKLTEKPGRTNGHEWRCRKQGQLNAHDVKKSVWRGSWFECNHLNILQILKITRYWYGRCLQDFVVNEVHVHEHVIVDWFMFCREPCMVTMVNESVP